MILENIATLRKTQASVEPAILVGSCKYSYNFPSLAEWYRTKERTVCRQWQRLSSYLHTYEIIDAVPVEESCGHLTSLNPAGLRVVSWCPGAPRWCLPPAAGGSLGLPPPSPAGRWRSQSCLRPGRPSGIGGSGVSWPASCLHSRHGVEALRHASLRWWRPFFISEPLHCRSGKEENQNGFPLHPNHCFEKWGEPCSYFHWLWKRSPNLCVTLPWKPDFSISIFCCVI